MNRTILTYGTFDLPHVGHIRLLKRLKDMGDTLIVGVSTDEFNLEKGKKSIFTFEERVEMIGALKFTDLVIAEKSWEQKVTDINTYGVDILAMGDDWAGKFDFLSSVVNVIYLPRTKGISTTDIRNVMSRDQEDKIMALEQSIGKIFRLVKSLRSVE